MTGTDAAELALQALMDCHRDAKWIASHSINYQCRVTFSEGFADATQLAAMACMVRDAIAQRIALIQPVISSAIAEREKSYRESGLKALH